jgi:telomerase reverse transcriptase
MYLHEMMQGMKVGAITVLTSQVILTVLQINNIEWLTPPGLGNQKSSQSDTRKRAEIFYEFLYYLIDSFLIPLIHGNFYVTESNVDRYRLFFFRHDVWRYVAEPALAVLKTTMFEEVRMEDARQILQSRRLGYSQVRLLPKQMKMRPIMNLRRRTLLQGNKRLLGPSINTILGPVSSVLKLEKVRPLLIARNRADPLTEQQTLNPSRLGASLFSVGDVYQRIKAFKTKLGGGQHKFYFAKVDVQAAFDTIPQDAMIELLKQIPQQSQYKLLKHAEVALPLSSTTGSSSATDAKPTRRWHTTAATSTDTRPFPQRLEEDAALRKNKNDTVFVHSAAQATHTARDLLALASAHVRQNLVRVGKKYYRQRAGIPQGSVLSSTLCNYFYADLERRCLPFLVSAGDDCLLMRLIDDFLLITTDRDKARRFVEVMHGGLPEYGVVVNAAKSLANFGLVVGGVEVPRVAGGAKFPYCGLLIDCATLAVAKGREGVRESGMWFTGRHFFLLFFSGGGRGADYRGVGIFNSLTVEYSRCPGKNFKRKVLSKFGSLAID